MRSQAGGRQEAGASKQTQVADTNPLYKHICGCQAAAGANGTSPLFKPVTRLSYLIQNHPTLCAPAALRLRVAAACLSNF